MRKNIVFFIFLFFFFLFTPKTIRATIGSPCCSEEVAGIRWYYDVNTNQCINTLGAKEKISCETQEKCNPGNPALRGTCVSSDFNPTSYPTISLSPTNIFSPGFCLISPDSFEDFKMYDVIITYSEIQEGKKYVVQWTNGGSWEVTSVKDGKLSFPFIFNNPGEQKGGTVKVLKNEFNGETVCTGTIKTMGDKNFETNPFCDSGQGINTALGCINTTSLGSFVGWFLGIIFPIASGIAFLLMAFGAFQITTSSGDPKKVQAGKELITSALTGLLFIILSVFLLELIGVDILKIPGLGE